MVWIHALVSNIDTFGCFMVYGFRKVRVNGFAILCTIFMTMALLLLADSLLLQYASYLDMKTTDALSVMIYLFLAYVTYKEYHKTTIRTSENKSDLNKNNAIEANEALYLGMYFSLDNFLLALPMIFEGYSPIYISVVFGVMTLVTMSIGYLAGKVIGERYQNSHFLRYIWLLFILLAFHHIYG